VTIHVPAQRAIRSPSQGQRPWISRRRVVKAQRADGSPHSYLLANRLPPSASDLPRTEWPARWASRFRRGPAPGPLALAGRTNGPLGRKSHSFEPGLLNAVGRAERSGAMARTSAYRGLSVGRIPTCLRPQTRRGFTLIELISTCILLGVVFSVSIPLLTVVAQERRSAEQRQFALQQATNLLERAMTKTWSELPVGTQELTAAPADVQTLLPGLERQVEVKELTETPRSKLVAVSIRWKSRSGEFVAPIRLSAWVYYPNGEGQP
jgi:prepilin-type N-terminal cleavage/methylation domain-containing protein